MSHKLRQDSVENSEDENRFEDAFWMEYYPKLQRYCHFLTQNKWDGEDVAQDTYLKAIRYMNQPQKMNSALLNKMAYHHWIDLLRKRKKETMESDFDCASHTITHQLDNLNDSVELLLKKFTPKQAVIFLLKEAFQYQLKEIADILDVTEIAVKSNLHRAKKRLEKANEEEQSFDLESFWDVEEREQLSELFYEALKNQDPTILIDVIPSLRSIRTEATLISRSFQKARPNISPSSTLCMAA
ncbi:RNA polymerase sigma factor (sigma-70 family) [Bacillus sp. SLBN-46]|uniref:sigma-70 family RNA polymerase sigma factor n=1 Tax=Bacillus sp. SLBN-46 TaxID=3042283 RepID=UPI002866F85A|nr:sigma-70 family RNA polymerase sigma factor [Bacillus sp. SLBN-46]MDR6123662.1 RNA polymerase sigma factor (sigma-70 family) [Bacillus sp. SLBN-46]